MGTPHPPNETGVPCPICWGPGKPFGDGPTPHTIELRLTRLLPGEFWDPAHEQLLLTTHWLTQEAAPCMYAINDGIFIWVVFWQVGTSQVDVYRIVDDKSVFRKGTNDECTIDFPSQHVVPDNVIAWNGFANITWNPEDLV